MKRDTTENSSAIAISLPEAAARLGVGISTLKILVWTGAIASFTVGRRRLIAVKSLEDFVEFRLEANAHEQLREK